MHSRSEKQAGRCNERYRWPATFGYTALRAFAQQFEKTEGRPPLPYEAVGYDNVMIVLEAMKKAGTTDPVKVREVLPTNEYKGVLQDYKFGGTNQSEIVINIAEIKDGKTPVITSLRTR